jgi:phenylacetate-coenzyme A ligase PaaK-like adenylate-forming protein
MRKSKIDDWIQNEEGFESFNRKVLEEYQLSAINELIRHSRQNSKFYSYLPEGVASFKEFSEIPFTSEKDLSRIGSLISQSEIERVITETTSGTAAAPKRIFFTAADQERTVSFFACGLSEVIAPGDATLIWMPGAGLCKLIAEAVARVGAAPTVCGTDKTFREILDEMKRKKINTAVALPAQLLSLARYARINNINLKLKGALISADECGSIEKYLEEELRCEIFPHYGSRECGLGGAITCAAHSGMHARENELYIETFNGELVITTLKRRATPLIRYRTGDRADILTGCPCGSAAKRIVNVRRIGLAVDMHKLNEKIFADKSVIDFSAETIGGELVLNISKDAEKPLYSGKRFVKNV